MTPCATFRELLLDAPTRELRAALDGSGPHGLGDHLDTCRECRAVARSIVRAMGALDAALDGAPEGVDADAILARAGRGGRRAVRRVRAIGLAASLAAAGLAALVVLDLDSPSPDLPPVARTPAAADIEVPEGRDVAVLPTGNPDITVLWIF